MKISRKLVIGNVVYGSGSQMLVQLITFFILPLFIKNLGPELYGIWILSGMLLGYVDFFDFGLTEGLQKYIAETRAHPKRVSMVVCTGLGTIWGIGFVLGCLILVFRWQLVDFFNVSDEHRVTASWLLVVTGWASMFNWPLRLGGVILMATLHYREVNIARGIYNAGNALVMLGMVVVFPDVIWIKVVTLLMQTLYQFYTFYLVRRDVPQVSFRPGYYRYRQLRRMARFSLSMFIFNLLGMLSGKLQPLLITYLLSPSHVAYYAITTKLYDLVMRFGMVFNSAVQPTAFNLKATKDTLRLEKLVERGVRYRLLLLGPLGVACIVVSRPFITAWVGPDYTQYAVWSQLFGFTILTAPLAVVVHVARACSELSVVNRLFAGMVLISFVVTVSLVNIFGIGAAVLGILVSRLFFGEVVFFPLYCRLCGVESLRTFKHYFKLVLWFAIPILLGRWCVSMFGVEGWWKLFLFAGVLIGGQYLAIFLWALSKEDRYDLKLALESVGWKDMGGKGKQAATLDLPRRGGA